MDVGTISIIMDEMGLNLTGEYMIDEYRVVLRELVKFIEKMKSVKTYIADAASRLQSEDLRKMDLERQLREVVYDVVDTFEASSSRRAAAMAKNICFRQLLIEQLDEALERSLVSIGSRKLDPLMNRIKAYKDLGIQQTQSTQTNQVLS